MVHYIWKNDFMYIYFLVTLTLIGTYTVLKFWKLTIWNYGCWWRLTIHIWSISKLSIDRNIGSITSTRYLFDNIILLSVSFGGICAVVDGLNDSRIFFERSSRRDFSSNSGGLSQSFVCSVFSSSSKRILCVWETKCISFIKVTDLHIHQYILMCWICHHI